MLTGKRFKLDRSTLALGSIEGGRKAVTIPAGAIVKVISGPTGDGDRMVDVLWESQTVTMFAVDVDVRGTEVRDQSATA
jgi:hypothetical protein